jgi:16S rRNA (cytosine1402-N4)-methyltransferase
LSSNREDAGRYSHEAVLKDEVVRWLQPGPNRTYIDATVGGGGHSKVLLRACGPTGTIIGIDQDPAALEAAGERLASLEGSAYLYRANFRELEELVASSGVERIDGILFDLGVSSYQFDTPERGFSYRADAPLDMRMDPERTLTARELVNSASRQELREILDEYGEERWAARIADFIVKRRKQSPLETTGELVKVIKQAIPAGARRSGPHPARRTFQALRIAVNNELENLKLGLEAAVNCTDPGARICVISFHSLEDRIVKHRFRFYEKDCICPPDLPVCRCDKQQELEVLTRGPITAGDEEIERNPRARSAKLRVAERV